MKKQASIISLGKTNLTNKNTGEVKTMCVVTYLIASEPTESFVGSIPRTAYLPEKNFEQLQKYVVKPNYELIYSSVPTNNGEKYRLEKFAEANLR